MPRSEPGLLVMCFNMATMLTTLLAHGQVLLVALGSPVGPVATGYRSLFTILKHTNESV